MRTTNKGAGGAASGKSGARTTRPASGSRRPATAPAAKARPAPVASTLAPRVRPERQATNRPLWIILVLLVVLDAVLGVIAALR